MARLLSARARQWAKRLCAPLVFAIAVLMVLALTGYKIYYPVTVTVSFYGSANQPQARKIIFVGNSLTYTHDMPAVVAALLGQKPDDRPVKVAMVTAPGARLKDHYRSGVLDHLLRKEGPWEMVIFQEQGDLVNVDPAQVEEYTRILTRLAIERGAKPLLFLDWCSQRRDNGPESGLVSLGRRLGMQMVPVHAAWAAVRQRYPSLRLENEEDGYHPSPLGTYLTACVFFGVIAGRTPEGLPWKLRLPEGSGPEVEWTAELSPDVACGLQMEAWKVVCEWGKTK